MKMKKTYIAIIVVIIIAGGYYWYKKTHTTSTAITYKTAAVEKGTLTTSISGSGNVIVDQSMNIDPTITGTVTNLSVSIGDSVKEGQALFTIINDQLSISAASAKNAYLQSQQSVELAKASLKQAQYDYDHNNSGSAQERILNNQLEAAKISLETAKQNVNISQAKYQSALSDAGKSKVTAPTSGTVNAINIKKWRRPFQTFFRKLTNRADDYRRSWNDESPGADQRSGCSQCSA
jgi:multidrug efflux pump subunit AcrA (membrane-fusion protein)